MSFSHGVSDHNEGCKTMTTSEMTPRRAINICTSVNIYIFICIYIYMYAYI